jgi:hypothetical protein
MGLLSPSTTEFSARDGSTVDNWTNMSDKHQIEAAELPLA